jgi:hypothetical protein
MRYIRNVTAYDVIMTMFIVILYTLVLFNS